MQVQKLLVLLLAITAFSGCFGGDTDDDDHDDNGDGHDDNGQGHDDNGQGQGDDNGTAPAPRNITFAAAPLNGTVPINVTFTAEVLEEDDFGDTFPYQGNFTYSLGFGDGETSQGDHTDFPLETVHLFNVSGNFTAVLRVLFEDGAELEGNLSLAFALPEEVAELPFTTFEFGPVLGCVGDDGPETCISREAGPDEPAIDGHWLALDERYWGLDLYTEVDKGMGYGSSGSIPNYDPFFDSDCWWLDADLNVIGNGHNGGDACTGTVPEGTAWLFLFSFSTPAAGFTGEFLV